MSADHRSSTGPTDAGDVGELHPLVELVDITKVFPGGVVANDEVCFDVRPGEVHGLLGENGAGKSTLMSILYGLYQPNGGSIRRRGTEVRLRSPAEALAAGIAMVQQHFSLVPGLTVAENVVLGQERGLLRDRRLLRSIIGELSERYQLDLDPAQKVGVLSIGQRQRVEILKCLYRDPEILVFDEPTTVLTPGEVDQLFDTLRELAREGRGIVLISHKLDELVAVTDRITVLRGGRSVKVIDTSVADPRTLAKLMVGRDVRLRSTAGFLGIDAPGAGDIGDAGDAEAQVRVDGHAAPCANNGKGQATQPAHNSSFGLHLHELSLRDHDGVNRLSGIDLHVGPGEIVGVAGVEGNGQRELVRLLTGTARASAGMLAIDRVDLTQAGPKGLRAAGLRVVTEDRHETGVVLDMSIAENLVVDRIEDREFSRLGVVDHRAVDRHAERLVDEYRIATPTVRTPMRLLSGGNQQRAVLARELSRPVRVLVASQPTRGLDVGAIEEVTDRILQARDDGAAVLIISADLAELFSVSDRIAVIVGGRVTAPVPVADTSPAQLGPLMAGLDAVESAS